MYSKALNPQATTIQSRATGHPVSSAGIAECNRRYDLDWLRVLAFGLLILYHCGMFYVADWGWHIKTAEPSAFLQNLMLLTNPWRMSLLFLVSGAALYFACGKINSGALVKLRSSRLLIPLLFGMAVIVPPQLYVELRTGAGAQFGYAEFYRLYLDAGTTAYPDYQHSPLGLWTWNHLWFLAYLWVYTLVFVLLKPILDVAALRLQEAPIGMIHWMLWPVMMLLVFRMSLADTFPPTNALFDDWYNHARYLSLLLGGYLLADCRSFWRGVNAYRWQLVLAAVITYSLLLTIFHGHFQHVFAGLNTPTLEVLVRLTVSANQWLWLLALLGLANHYLTASNRFLRYMNSAILPWYMLHQTLIVLLAFGLSSLQLPQGIEALLLIIGTVIGCALGYELIRPFKLGKLLFGLKSSGAVKPSHSPSTLVLR